MREGKFALCIRRSRLGRGSGSIRSPNATTPIAWASSLRLSSPACLTSASTAVEVAQLSQGQRDLGEQTLGRAVLELAEQLGAERRVLRRRGESERGLASQLLVPRVREGQVEHAADLRLGLTDLAEGHRRVAPQLGVAAFVGHDVAEQGGRHACSHETQCDRVAAAELVVPATVCQRLVQDLARVVEEGADDALRCPRSCPARPSASAA